VSRWTFAAGVALLMTGLVGAEANAGSNDQKWAASWTTPISGVFKKLALPPGLPPAMLAQIKAQFPQQEFDYALPDGKANDQTFRMIVRPDLWGEAVRIRLSNVFGDRDIDVGSTAIGLQEYAGAVAPGTNRAVTFAGHGSVKIPAGQQIFSDPVRLSFVTKANMASWRGRNLAISFAIRGNSGGLSSHYSRINSYISAPASGDHAKDEDDSAFPNVTSSYFLVSELDVRAPADTVVICALGDSITDTITSTDGHDGWSDDLSERLHKLYAGKISIVNMGVSGNTVVAKRSAFDATDPLVDRLDRDVLAISGLNSVILLEGINDLGAGRSKPEPIIDGYKQVIERLHAKGIGVIGATLTSSVWPEPNYDNAPITSAGMAAAYGNPQTNDYRKQLNEFIRDSGVFDGAVDMAQATDDPATGALYKNFQVGDYLHPNRAGHWAMASAVDLDALMRLARPARK
jgi:lysophospholipase L1-like esterase